MEFKKWGFYLNETLKGQSNEILYPQFFSSFEQACATDQWVKMFSFLVSFSPRYSYFSVEKTDSAQYDTARSQKKKFSWDFAAKIKNVALF